jgi:hypothetical protein
MDHHLVPRLTEVELLEEQAPNVKRFERNEAEIGDCMEMSGSPSNSSSTH